MAWWNRFFKKKEPVQQEEDWEQLVYTRNGVNFDEEDQRKRYIVNCLEQIAEASKEIDLLTGEYTLVTSYLTDTDEIEALPKEQRSQVNSTAARLAGLEQERNRYREKKNLHAGCGLSMRSARERTRSKKEFRRSVRAKNTAIWSGRTAQTGRRETCL